MRKRNSYVPGATKWGRRTGRIQDRPTAIDDTLIDARFRFTKWEKDVARLLMEMKSVGESRKVFLSFVIRSGPPVTPRQKWYLYDVMWKN